ncbi:MAG: hypothetical protein GY737_18635, partial [Desulfobacteraceae bacterium]|nr:hypothetical protein [Desulfobacteraceae bacterium]
MHIVLRKRQEQHEQQQRELRERQAKQQEELLQQQEALRKQNEDEAEQLRQLQEQEAHDLQMQQANLPLADEAAGMDTDAPIVETPLPPAPDDVQVQKSQKSGPSAARLENVRQVDFGQVVQYPSDEDEDNQPKPIPRKDDPRYKGWYPNLAIQWPPGGIEMLKEEHLELWHSVCCRRQKNYLPCQSWHIYDEIVKHHKDQDLTYLEPGIEKFRPPPKGASSQTSEGHQERGRPATASNARKRTGSAQLTRQKSQRRDRSKMSSKGQPEE